MQRTLYNYCLHMELIGVANLIIAVGLQPLLGACNSSWVDGAGRSCKNYGASFGTAQQLCTVHPPYGIPFWCAQNLCRHEWNQKESRVCTA